MPSSDLIRKATDFRWTAAASLSHVLRRGELARMLVRGRVERAVNGHWRRRCRRFLPEEWGFVAYAIVLDPQAIDDLRDLRAFDRRAVVDTIERVLGSAPERVSRSRIKRLRGIDSPQYRLRVDEFRIFYDVEGGEVYVLRVLPKAAVERYLKELGYEDR